MERFSRGRFLKPALPPSWQAEKGPREGTNEAILKGPFSDCEPP